MLLRLRHPPTPEFAGKHADVAVASVKRIDKVVLDYSPKASLSLIASFRAYVVRRAMSAKPYSVWLLRGRSAGSFKTRQVVRGQGSSA